MRKLLMVFLLVLSGGAPSVWAHTLYAIPPVDAVPAVAVTTQILNGSFWKNEAMLKGRWMTEPAVIGPDGQAIDEATQTTDVVPTLVNFVPHIAGVYTVATATRTRMARLSAEKFNAYLIEEGLHDAIADRESLAENDIASAEKYTKFAKTLIQVGDSSTGKVDVAVGHPVEIIPLTNPAALTTGETFRGRILINGKPAANKLVYANSQHNVIQDGSADNEYFRLRSDADGIFEFTVTEAGTWYTRCIDIERTGDSEHWYSDLLVWLGSEEPRIPYESNWATLSFVIR